jgi:hypothetical protein
VNLHSSAPNVAGRTGLRRELLALLLIAFVAASGGCSRVQQRRVAESIRAEYECSLFSLGPTQQGHFGVRMYRMTGDERYLPPIAFDLLVTVETLRADIDHISDSAWVDRRSQDLLEAFREETRKGGLRQTLFEKQRTMLLYLDLLEGADKIAQYGLDDAALASTYRSCVGILKDVDFASFLLDPDVIRVYSAQAVNDVYYLHALGITDIRGEYAAAFRSVFPDEGDSRLSSAEFEDKVYGMTHFVIAASGYYQHPVDEREFAWILEYFDRNIGRIAAQTRPDVVAEVGICFLLAGQKEHEVVDVCRDVILLAFDADKSMILSTQESDDFARGEHRNVLAYMLLEWPDTLHTGPMLSEPGRFRALFPEGFGH